MYMINDTIMVRFKIKHFVQGQGDQKLYIFDRFIRFTAK